MRYTDHLRKIADKVWEANYNHPFVQGIGNGTLTEDRFRFFLRQDYVYLIDFCKFFGIAAAKAHQLNTMAKFSESLNAILNFEMNLHRSVCAEFDITPEELERTVASPANLAYTSYLLRVAYEGDAGDIMAALLPCLWGYAEIGARLKAKGLPRHKHYAKWIETYASPEFQALTDWSRSWLDEYASHASEEKKRRMEEIFMTTSKWEHIFWEMAWKKEEWPV